MIVNFGDSNVDASKFEAKFGSGQLDSADSKKAPGADDNWAAKFDDDAGWAAKFPSCIPCRHRERR